MKAFRDSGAPLDAPAPGGGVLRILRPADGGLVGEMPVSSPEEVRKAVRKCRRVQRDWASLSVDDRVRRLRGVRQVMARRSEDVAAVIMEETGKPEPEALAEVNVVLELLRYYERRAPRLLALRRAPVGWLRWKRARVYQDPFGVVGVIAPGNYPFILAADPLLTALFAGNGAVLKPSEHAPFTGRLLGELCREGGLPHGLVHVVQGGGEVGEALVHAGLDRLHFTGATETGRRVMAAAALELIPLSLELSAKDVAVVLEDADLDRAARGIVWGAFSNAGQTCLATERVYVVDEVYDPFVGRLLGEIRSLRVGSGGWVDVGPISTPDQLAWTEAQLRNAVAAGARVLTGGARADPASNVFLPTVLADVPREARVATEETFGPVLLLYRVRDEAEALAKVKEGPQRLFSSAWTEDVARGEALAGRLGAGGCSVNDVLSHYALPSLPMGGVGRSGFGRIRGDEGLLGFTRSRALLVDRGFWRREPWWFPYRPISSRLQRALTEVRGRGGLRGWLSGLGRLLPGWRES